MHVYTYICIYTYVAHNLQWMCRRCVCWCQRNICMTHSAHALVPRTSVLECAQHSLQKNAHIYMRTHICIRIHIHKNTHAHLWHRPNTLKNSYWDSKSMHKRAWTQMYTCIYMHAFIHKYTHADIYIYACSYTHIHTHIYTHTYNMYICTYTCTPGTTALQWLREKPNLTPRKLSTSLLEALVSPPFNEICFTRNDR